MLKNYKLDEIFLNDIFFILLNFKVDFVFFFGGIFLVCDLMFFKFEFEISK